MIIYKIIYSIGFLKETTEDIVFTNKVVPDNDVVTIINGFVKLTPIMPAIMPAVKPIIILNDSSMPIV